MLVPCAMCQEVGSASRIQVFETVAPKEGCTAPMGTIALPEAPKVGLSERSVRHFTVEAIIDRALRNFYHFFKPIHLIKNLLTMKRWYIRY
jgi:hypothetical protein